jgi:amidase
MHGSLVTGQQPSAENIEPLSMWLYETGMGVKGPEYVAAVVTLQAFARGVIQASEAYDVLVTPALAQRPVRHGEIDPCGEDPAWEFKKSGQFTPFTPGCNITGQPAISVPLFHGDDGLPTAAQLIGPPVGEGLLLALCRQLEEAAPWADRAPPTPAAA